MRRYNGWKLPLLLVSAALASAASVAPASAEDACKEMRKLSIGIAVAPPNVVHTAPFVAKELGFFTKHCIDANLIQFDGGAAGTSVTSVAQGTTLGTLPDLAIAHGLKGKQLWGLAPRLPQAYTVTEEIKTAADLKGKRLSAAGGVGGFNWLMGREVLRTANLTVDDASFISQGTAGRLPGLLVGQLDAVSLHPEDLYLAQQKKPGLHPLVYLGELLPKYMFNAYGAADALLAKDRELLRDAVAAMIEGNRAMYREREKVVPIIVKATAKPADAVNYALDVETKNCVLSVNGGLSKERGDWTMQRNVDVGDLKPEQKVPFEQVVDMKFNEEAVAAAGGPMTINGCKD